MRRETSTPRPGWQQKLEQLGFDYYVMDGKAYWTEQACYAFTADEIDELEAATEALLLLQGPASPDVLLTDVVLGGGMNGIDLAQAARELRPGLPLIFMSGYTTVPEAQQRIRDSGAPLLAKPFTTTQLVRAVNTVCASLK